MPAAQYQQRFMHFMREVFAPREQSEAEPALVEPRGARGLAGRLRAWWQFWGDEGGSGGASFQALLTSDDLIAAR